MEKVQWLIKSGLQSFLVLLTFWPNNSLLWGCLMHWKMFSSTSGLYPLEANSRGRADILKISKSIELLMKMKNIPFILQKNQTDFLVNPIILRGLLWSHWEGQTGEGTDTRTARSREPPSFTGPQISMLTFENGISVQRMKHLLHKPTLPPFIVTCHLFLVPVFSSKSPETQVMHTPMVTMGIISMLYAMHTPPLSRQCHILLEVLLSYLQPYFMGGQNFRHPKKSFEDWKQHHSLLLRFTTFPVLSPTTTCRAFPLWYFVLSNILGGNILVGGHRKISIRE